MVIKWINEFLLHGLYLLVYILRGLRLVSEEPTKISW